MKAVSITLFVFLLCATAYSQPKLHFDFHDAREAGLVVIGPNDAGFDGAIRTIEQHPQSQMKGFEALRPYSFIVLNGTARTIAMLSVRWEENGQFAGHFLYRTRRNVVEPIFKPGETLLLFPGMPAAGSVGPGFAVLTGNWQPRRFQAAKELTVSLDAVIFGDGELVGRDKSGVAERWEAERQALRDTAADLERETAGGADGTAFLQSLASMRMDHTAGIEGHARDAGYHYGAMRAGLGALLLTIPKDGRTRAKIAAGLRDRLPAIHRKGNQ